MRVVRPIYLALLTPTMRLLRRLYNRATAPFGITADDLRGAVAAVSPAATFDLRFRDTAFRLFVQKDLAWMYRVCARWAAGEEVYEVVMLECLTRLLRRIGRADFIDIGACMGHYACYAAALLGGRVRTFAVESNPGFCRAIERSAQLNGFESLRVFNVALSDRSERVRIDGQTVAYGGGDGASAQALTLDELCRREGICPKVVKIDVHGAEGKVVAGMHEVMRDGLEFILLEVHPKPYLSRHSGESGRDEILDLLEQRGFAVFYMVGHRYQGTTALADHLATAGFTYRRLDERSRDLLLLDRPEDVFLLCTRHRELEPFLGPSVPDPCFDRSLM
jgi:FkbM family methyltransferase